MSRKVLVVDDEKLIVKGIRFNLEQDGMEVDCAYDGEQFSVYAPLARFTGCNRASNIAVSHEKTPHYLLALHI